jgi:uncharacterized repeat protein (TIGR04052 family)
MFFRPLSTTSLLVCLIFAAGCESPPQTVTLTFSGQVGDATVRCGETYTTAGTRPTPLKVNDFRFYISNVRLLTAEGQEVPLALQQDSLWQYQNVALLDFEDGTADCAEGGTPGINNAVVGTVPPGTYQGVAFTLGVPDSLNHLDAAVAPSPLNVSAMFWSWRAGYIFSRIDLAVPRGDSTSYWLMHLGSTGCEAEAATMPPRKACTRPNRVEVHLSNFNPETDIIVADVAGLARGIDLTVSEPAPPGCMSGPDDPDCSRLFPNFGLALETGTCSNGNCVDQGYFRSIRQEERPLAHVTPTPER